MNGSMPAIFSIKKRDSTTQQSYYKQILQSCIATIYDPTFHVRGSAKSNQSYIVIFSSLNYLHLRPCHVIQTNTNKWYVFVFYCDKLLLR
jgi:hypothetical protein